MRFHPTSRLLKFLSVAAPLAVLCVATSFPAAAITIDGASAVSVLTAHQLAKAEKQALKAQRKTEKRARKLCKKRMKQARRQGLSYTCGSSSAAPEPEMLAASPESTPTPESSPAAGAPDTSTNGAAAPGSSSKPPPGTPSNPPSSPGATPPASGPGETDGIIRNALLGEDAIPAGFILPPIAQQQGSPPVFLVETVPTQQVPEPGSLMLLGAGLLGLSLAARRTRPHAA